MRDCAGSREKERRFGMDMDKPHEECGVFGVYNATQCDVVRETFLALHALQHRGQESCGIAVSDDGVFRAFSVPISVPRRI